MAFEIDFLPVGDGERSGDAIAMRFGEVLKPGSQTVLVIDGETKESGKALVAHVTNYYGTGTVDAVICSHSDADHASGLTEVSSCYLLMVKGASSSRRTRESLHLREPLLVLSS